MSTKSILFVVIIAAAGAASREYAGPRCLGPFCLNARVSDRSLFDRLGTTAKASPGNLHCYESSDGGAFLYFETIDTQPHTVGDVFVSLFPNCMHMGVHKTSTNLQEWKTPQGIGL